MQARSLRLRAIAALVVAVCAGLIVMAVAAAPRGYMIGNSIALVIGTVLAFLPIRLPTERQRRALIGGFLIVLALTAFAGPPLDGVRRWIAIGPLRLHAGMLLGPTLAVVLALAPPALRIGGLLAGIAIAFVSPDLAMALAWLGTLLGSLNRLRPWHATASMTAAALIVAATALRHDPLQPVAFVEAVVVGVWHTSPSGAIALALAGLAPLLLVLFREPPARALAGFWAGLSLAGLIGPWPSPLIGYGAAPILGYGLSVAVWRGLQSAAARA